MSDDYRFHRLFNGNSDEGFKGRHCILCGGFFIGHGNNPEPLAPFESGKACNPCNSSQVLFARISNIQNATARHNAELKAFPQEKNYSDEDLTDEEFDAKHGEGEEE